MSSAPKSRAPWATPYEETGEEIGSSSRAKERGQRETFLRRLLEGELHVKFRPTRLEKEMLLHRPQELEREAVLLLRLCRRIYLKVME